MDGGAWWAAVCGVAQSWIQLKQLSSSSKNTYWLAMELKRVAITLNGGREILVAQSCLIFCDPMEYSPSGYSVHGILQARILQWVAIFFSRGSSWPRNQTPIPGRFFTIWATRELYSFLKGEMKEKKRMCVCVCVCVYQIRSDQSLSRVRLFATPWIAAHQASLSITISRSSLRLTSIESVMPSSHLILCRPLLLLPPIPPSIRVFSNESTLCMRWLPL